MLRNVVTILPQFVKKLFYDHDISKLGLGINKTQTNILMFIDENNDKSMTEISSITGLEKSSFTRSVDYLVENGFIEKNPQMQDRRVITLSLSRKGIKAAQVIREDFDSYCESLLSCFSAEEREEFLSSLATVSRYVHRLMDGEPT